MKPGYPTEHSRSLQDIEQHRWVLLEAGSRCRAWLTIGDMGDEELNEKLFPESQTVKPEPMYPMPEWGKMNIEKRQRGVTLRLLWQEYKE